jgi:hypothetical protein
MGWGGGQDTYVQTCNHITLLGKGRVSHPSDTVRSIPNMGRVIISVVVGQCQGS